MVVSSLQPRDFLASVDIKDAYLHVPIFPHQKFSGFAVEDHYFQFVALLIRLFIPKYPGSNFECSIDLRDTYSEVPGWFASHGAICSPSAAQCICHSTHSGKVWLAPQFPEISIDSSSAFGIFGPAPGHCPGKGDSLSREVPCSKKLVLFPQVSLFSLGKIVSFEMVSFAQFYSRTFLAHTDIPFTF